MPENQVALNDNRKKQIKQFFKAMPDTAGQVAAQMDAAYKDGTIDRKTKHLMALGIALGVGCRNCVLAHTEAALKFGATKQEFLETISVVTSMRGTTGVAEALRVIQFLDELEPDPKPLV